MSCDFKGCSEEIVEILDSYPRWQDHGLCEGHIINFEAVELLPAFFRWLRKLIIKEPSFCTPCPAAGFCDSHDGDSTHLCSYWDEGCGFQPPACDKCGRTIKSIESGGERIQLVITEDDKTYCGRCFRKLGLSYADIDQTTTWNPTWQRWD